MNKALERVPLSRQHASVAHLVERHLAKVEVASSSLVGRSICGSLAQLGEHLPYKQRVIGSSPIGPISIENGLKYYADVAQLAEQLICNQQVIGSSPIIGFFFFGPLAQLVRATGS